MKILGIESASLVASAALLEDRTLISEFTTNYRKTHSETLLPMIDEMLRVAGIKKTEIGLIAVSEGPGSFTGLRIGASVAKGLAFALDVPIVPVSTTAAMAYGCYAADRILCPLMDARRNQVYTGIYEFSGSRFNCLLPASALPIEEAVGKAMEWGGKYGRRVLYLGDGLRVFSERVKALDPSADLAPAHVCFQRAASVAALGQALYEEGRAVSAAEFLPVYLRKSQAEREREEQLAKEAGEAAEAAENEPAAKAAGNGSAAEGTL